MLAQSIWRKNWTYSWFLYTQPERGRKVSKKLHSHTGMSSCEGYTKVSCSSVWFSNISKAARTQPHAQASRTGQSLFLKLQVDTYIQKEVKPSLSHFLLVILSTFSCFLLLLTQVNLLLQVPVLFQLFSEHECLTSVDEWCPVYFPLGKAEKQSLLIMSMINSTTVRKERWGKDLSYWKR